MANWIGGLALCLQNFMLHTFHLADFQSIKKENRFIGCMWMIWHAKNPELLTFQRPFKSHQHTNA